jgi:hypothetical protein
MKGPLIKQIVVIAEEGGSPTIYGLDEAGGMWEHTALRQPAVCIYDEQGKHYIGTSQRIYAHEACYTTRVQEALAKPERFKITWENGRTAGWVPVSEPGELSQVTTPPLKP